MLSPNRTQRIAVTCVCLRRRFVFYRAWLRSRISESDAFNAAKLWQGYFAIGYRGATGFILYGYYADALAVWRIGAGGFRDDISILPAAFIYNIRNSVIYAEKNGIGEQRKTRLCCRLISESF